MKSGFFPLAFRTMNNSESARKLNQAVNNTSKAVGGALSQAKGAISSFLSTFSVQPVTATTETTTTHPESYDPMPIDKPIKIAEDGGAETNVKHGIVEIGRDANVFDSINKNNDVIGM